METEKANSFKTMPLRPELLDKTLKAISAFLKNKKKYSIVSKEVTLTAEIYLRNYLRSWDF